MKYLVVLLMSTLCSFAGTGTSIVTNTPLCVAALVGQSAVASLPAWAITNAYSAGDIVRVGNVPALCVVAGTSSNIPPAISAVDVVDFSCTWRAVQTDRSTLGISNIGGSTVYLAPSAAAGKGLAIPSGSSIVLSNGDAKILKVYLSTVSGLSTNNIVEW